MGGQCLFPREREEAATVAGFALGFREETLPSVKVSGDGQSLCKMQSGSEEEPPSTGPDRVSIPQNGPGIGRVGTVWAEGLSFLSFCVPGAPSLLPDTLALMSGEAKISPETSIEKGDNFSPRLTGPKRLGLGGEKHPPGQRGRLKIGRPPSQSMREAFIRRVVVEGVRGAAKRG